MFSMFSNKSYIIINVLGGDDDLCDTCLYAWRMKYWNNVNESDVLLLRLVMCVLGTEIGMEWLDVVNGDTNDEGGDVVVMSPWLIDSNFIY